MRDEEQWYEEGFREPSLSVSEIAEWEKVYDDVSR
jgi:hypothetical protein